MSIVTLSVTALLCGWLATLILQSDLDSLSLLDVTVGVSGAALVGGLLAPVMGVSTLGEYGFSLSGIFVSWLGAMTLLVLINLARHGRIRCGQDRAGAFSRKLPSSAGGSTIPGRAA